MKSLKEKGMNPDEYYGYLKNAPEDVLSDMLSYYANRVYLWNTHQITLDKTEVRDVIDFQKAIDKLGISKKEFDSYRENVMKEKLFDVSEDTKLFYQWLLKTGQAKVLKKGISSFEYSK